MPATATRPRNRRQLIVAAAGRAFSERGYHGASMEEIAAGVGISATALYRHFPNKYALFAECANAMVDGLVAALDAVPSAAPLSDVLAAVPGSPSPTAPRAAYTGGRRGTSTATTASCSGRSSRT